MQQLYLKPISIHLKAFSYDEGNGTECRYWSLRQEEADLVLDHCTGNADYLEFAKRLLWYCWAHCGTAESDCHLCDGRDVVDYGGYTRVGDVHRNHLCSIVLCEQFLVQFLARQRRTVWSVVGLGRYHGLLCRPYDHPLPRWFHPCYCRHKVGSRRVDGKDAHQAVWQEE